MPSMTTAPSLLRVAFQCTMLPQIENGLHALAADHLVAQSVAVGVLPASLVQELIGFVQVEVDRLQAVVIARAAGQKRAGQAIGQTVIDLFDDLIDRHGVRTVSARPTKRSPGRQDRIRGDMQLPPPELTCSLVMRRCRNFASKARVGSALPGNALIAMAGFLCRCRHRFRPSCRMPANSKLLASHSIWLCNGDPSM